MSIETLFTIFLLWTIAGVLAAIAFGKAIHFSAAAEDEESLVSSAGTVKYLHQRVDNARPAKTAEGKLRHVTSKRASS